MDESDGRLENLLQTEQADRPPPTILIVDDEPYVLRAIRRLLKTLDAEILTAPNGLQALKVLKEEEVGVLISDQFMPGMSGTELLEHARAEHPNTVRVMLTGNNDLATAVEAINKGDVFRFVLKPWRNDELTQIVQMALDHHKVLVDAQNYQHFIQTQNDRLSMLNEELERRVQERTSALLASREQISDLYSELQESFDATIRVLLSSMELGDIKIVDHCRRTATRVQQLADEISVSVGTIKPLVRAGLLHWIGLIGASSAMFRKEVEDFDVEEQATWEFHTLLGHQVISSVAALRRTSHIVLYYERDYDDENFRVGTEIDSEHRVDEDLLLSCRILRICSHFERTRTMFKARGTVMNDEGEKRILDRGITKLKQGAGTRFDPALVRRFTQLLQQEQRQYRAETKLDSILDLQPGMVLARPLETLQGIPVAPRDIVVTEELLQRFQLFQKSGGLAPIYIWT